MSGILKNWTRRLALLFSIALGLLGLAAWGGAFSPRLDGVTHFAPICLVLCLLAGVLGWAVRREGRRTALVIGLCCAAIWGGLIAPELVRIVLDGKARGASATVKIVQFNVWGADKSSRDKIAWILSQKADFVVLEEVSRNARPLLEGLSQTYPYSLSCETKPHPCSVMILSKSPSLADGRLGQRKNEPNTVWGRFRGDGGDFVVMGTHVDWPLPDGRQQAQLGVLAAKALEIGPQTLILTGDFNSTPWSFALRKMDRDSGLVRRTHGTATWPTTVYAPLPLVAIDQVYAGKDWRTVNVKRGPYLGSDHYPVVVTLVRR